jgi:iron complex outermembrane receptor protein
MSSATDANRCNRARLSSASVVPLLLLGIAPGHAQQNVQLDTINVTASRVPNGLVGTSTSVITAEDIAHSPAQTIQEIIARTHPQDLLGGG